MTDPRWLYIACITLSLPAIVGLPPLPDAPLLTGKATWYGEPYIGRTMQDGTPYDPEAMTCAVSYQNWDVTKHRYLLICTDETILELSGAELTKPGRCVKCLVTDTYYADGVDLSRAAFRRLAPLGVGVVNVNVWRLQ